jgi:hypothetical protein
VLKTIHADVDCALQKACFAVAQLAAMGEEQSRALGNLKPSAGDGGGDRRLARACPLRR